MPQRVEDLPGFEAICGLGSSPEGEIWTSADGTLKLTVVPQLYVPCRAVLSASSYREWRAGAHVFLAERLLALAHGEAVDPEVLVVMEDEQSEPDSDAEMYEAPLLRLMASLKPGETPLSIENLWEDKELFIDLAWPDYVRALKDKYCNINLTNEPAYRRALAYFAIKGLLSDIARWPQKMQKRASQRERSPNRVRPEVVTTPPVDSWLPNDIKPWVLSASEELAERTKGCKTTDLLSKRIWHGIPQAVMRRLDLAGTPTDKIKMLNNAFTPKAEGNARYFTVVHFLLNRPN